MNPKISVVTVTFRPGYIDNLVDSLVAQTLSADQWEYILLDELWELRKDTVKAYVGDRLNFRHIPLKPNPMSNTAEVVNTALIHARGELVYLMADYMYIHPKTLERHWEIFCKYGPKVLISGPLLDRITASGKSLYSGAEPVMISVKVGNEVVSYPEATPPIEWPMKDNIETPTADNLISIWKQPFKPRWPHSRVLPDWRLGSICRSLLDDGLFETQDWKWWWGGRNDALGLEAALDANGMDDRAGGRRAGLESDMARRMMEQGCRYMVDTLYPGYMLPHPWRKPELSDWKGHSVWVSKDGAPYSLREERKKLGR